MTHNPALAYRPDIDGLRAIAVLSVVAYHAFPTRIHGGFVGVDVFFVISGYLISGIILKGLEKGTFSFAGFYARRIRRIFPALIVVLLASLAFGWFALLPDEYERLGKHTAAGAAFVANFALWRESGYFDATGELKPLLHLWSLGIEEQFYILWPLLLAIFWGRTRKLWIPIAAIAALSFAANVAYIASEPVATFYSPLTRFWELLLGCLLACFALHQQRNLSSPPWPKWSVEVASALGIVFIASSLALVTTEKPFPGWLALLPTLGAVLAIAAGPSAFINRVLLAHPVMVFFGLISYPLYLWHWPILSYLKILVPDEVGAHQVRAMKVAAIGLAVLLSWITFQYVEKRIRYSKGRQIVSGLAAAAGVAVCAGLVVLSFEGIVSRTSLTTDPFAWSDARLRSAACEKYFNIKAAKEEFCVIGGSVAPASPIDILIGDSHANALFPAFELAAARQGRSAVHVGGAGCFPAKEVRTYSGHSGNTEHCVRRIPAFLDAALRDPRIERVFIAARWAYFLDGRSFTDPQDSPRKLRMNDSDDRHAVFAASLNATLDRVRDSGKKIYFVHQVPELDFNPKACLRLRPIEFFKPVRVACSIPSDKVVARQADYRSLVAHSLQSRPFVQVVDPVPRLCDGHVCAALSGATVLYRDDNHLSAEAGSIIEPLFRMPQRSAPSARAAGEEKS